MKTTLKHAVLCLTLVLAFILPGTAMAAWDDTLIIVITDTQLANETTQDWLNFLEQLGVPTRLISPAEFEAEKANKYMALMATPGDPELNGDILPLLVDEAEIAWLSETGNRKFYYIDDKFADGQTILLFAGANQRGAEIVRQNNREDWELTLCSWFDIVASTITLYGY